MLVPGGAGMWSTLDDTLMAGRVSPGENVFRWATVVTAVPLGIQFDGDSLVLPATPDALVDLELLRVGARVWVQLYGRRVVIIGVAGGGRPPALRVRAATTVNITTPTGAQTVDGVALVVGDRVLLKDQTTPQSNGIHVVAGGAWTRATDHDSAVEIAGSTVAVSEGTVNGGTHWVTNYRVTDIYPTSPANWFLVGPQSDLWTPYARAAGSVAVTAPTAPAGVSTTVTFPAGRFSVAPIVTTGVTSNGYMASSMGGVTTSGCALRAWSLAGTPTGCVIHWSAKQMTPTSASG